MVLIRFKNRTSLCISSQVGCRMGCKFCATGTMGLLKNLTCGEILEQIYWALYILKNENNENLYKGLTIVFMGMGEPLDNYFEVTSAIRCMTDREMFNLGYKRIT